VVNILHGFWLFRDGQVYQLETNSTATAFKKQSYCYLGFGVT